MKLLNFIKTSARNFLCAIALLAIAPLSYATPPVDATGIARAIAAQEHAMDALMSRAGVVGTAVSLGEDGKPVVSIFVASKAHVRGLPRDLDGVPTQVRVTGRFYASAPGECKGPNKNDPGCPGAGDGGGDGGGTSEPNCKGKPSQRDPECTNIEEPAPEPLACSGDGVNTNNPGDVDNGCNCVAGYEQIGSPGSYACGPVACSGDGVISGDVVTGCFCSDGYTNTYDDSTGLWSCVADQPVEEPDDPWGGATNTQAKYRPSPIGVSTSPIAVGYYGTLGARVKDASGNVYALSNNHVYADENNTPIGTAAVQPGGRSSLDDKIGELSAFEPIVFSTSASNIMDAAIALSSIENLSNRTLSDGYGTPRSTPTSAQLGMQVMKSGARTRFTNGRVTGVNATIYVGYGSGTARFVGQIIIEGPGDGSSFSAPGDSGSLVVSNDAATARQPVGLLFAGNSTITVISPIGPILSRFGVTIDGN